jgi:uncharacterized protein YndB with AHSA1/START domain
MDQTYSAPSDTILRLRHRFQATPERVFAAWTRPDALRLWWCPAGWHPAEVEVDLRAGGSYRLSMNKASSNRPVTVHGRFLEVKPPRKLVYTWLWDGAFPQMPETRVTVEFRAVAGGTELSLRQEDLALPYCVQHLSGWLAAWDRITQVVSAPIGQTLPSNRMQTGTHAI